MGRAGVLDCVPGEGGLSQPHASTGLPVATDSSDMAETQTGRTRTLPNDPWKAVGSTRLAACRVGRFSWAAAVRRRGGCEVVLLV